MTLQGVLRAPPPNRWGLPGQTCLTRPLGDSCARTLCICLGLRGVREALALAVSVQHSTYGEDSQVSLFLGAPLRTAGRGFQHRGDVCVNTGS